VTVGEREQRSCLGELVEVDAGLPECPRLDGEGGASDHDVPIRLQEAAARPIPAPGAIVGPFRRVEGEGVTVQPVYTVRL
jgi:hypothetical protein